MRIELLQLAAKGCKRSAYIENVRSTGFMIKSFKSKPLKALWETGRSKIDDRLHQRILRRLDALDAAMDVEDVNLPGFNFHSLRGYSPTRYTLHVNGPWCITFEFEDGNAYVLDFEQYH